MNVKIVNSRNNRIKKQMTKKQQHQQAATRTVTLELAESADGE